MKSYGACILICASQETAAMQVARVVRKPDSFLLNGRHHTSFVRELNKLRGWMYVSGGRRCVSTVQDRKSV
jgi:hypothetical protein